MKKIGFKYCIVFQLPIPEFEELVKLVSVVALDLFVPETTCYVLFFIILLKEKIVNIMFGILQWYQSWFSCQPEGLH